MKKVLVVFGTRPEAIKMCPLVRELKANTKDFSTCVCVTGQHKEMLKQVLDVFEVIPEYDLGLMKRNQSLSDITCGVLSGVSTIIDEFDPDVMLVHGDTTTSFAAGLAGFYKGIPVGHVEAGLRTHNMKSPWPEEFNRTCIDLFTQYYFAPTAKAVQNLLSESVDESKIFLTGNTAIDALRYTVKDDYENEVTEWAKGSKLVLITAHRRENLGKPMHEMFKAIRKVLIENEDVKAIYPIHMNPKVREIAESELSGIDRLRIIEPLQVIDFHNLMNSCHLILTDSGGIQEEAPSLGKPVLVMRDTTERPEGIEAGTLKLVGTSEKNIYKECNRLLHNREAYRKMSNASNPYGDGNASKRIVEVLKKIN